MEDVRPQVPPQPCPVCGTDVDPLRAGEVMLLQDGFRFLCDRECRRRYVDGERAHDRSPVERPSQPPIETRRDPSTGRIRTGDPVDLEPLVFEPAPVELPASPPPWPGLLAAAAGLVLGAVASSPALAALSAASTALAAASALQVSWGARREVGLVVWAIGPAGAVLAAGAGWLAGAAQPQSWALAGAAVAAGAMVGRAWLDARMRDPVERVVRVLPSALPPRVRVPLHDESSPGDLAFVAVDTDKVRTGEEVLAVEGETVAVDGVVKAGEARALLHHGAQAPVRRGPGDSLLAGARITEGAVRLLATRVGDDRAVARPAHFGSAEGPRAARLTRLATRVSRWAGLTALGGAILAIAMAGGEGASAQLSAAAAVLLAAPLLAIRRSSELPLVAAAATAAARGIIFQGARSLDTAGRAAVAALCTRGTITEGVLEVVEVHPIDGADASGLTALAAAAEAVAEEHPIGIAIRRFAESRGIAPESVRRATFLPGRGVTALGPGGEPLVIGNRRLLLDEGVSVAMADDVAARAEARGHTALFVGLGGRVRAVVSLQDTVRAGARAAVQRMFDLQLEVVLLSGDHRPTVESLARNLDVANVRAELLPEERGAEVQRLRETGGVVAAIGWARDEAALSAADVPIVLDAAGGAAGDRTVALATDDVRDAAAALWIARAARQASWRAFVASLAAGSLIVTTGALGLAPPAVAALFAVAVDAFALPSGTRLLRRIALRVPARS